MVRPFKDLTKKNTPFNWKHLCQVNFDTIKTTLTNSPIVIFLDPN